MKDPCQTSIEILQESCLAWFRAKGIPGPVHFPDTGESLFNETSTGTVNVVFFGSALRRFVETATWRPRKYRFWVLCGAMNDLLTQLIGVPGHQVATVPRYELFPASRAPRPFPRLGKRMTLVFSGRISPTKNIEFLLKTVSYLQVEQRLPVELALIGRVDSELHADRDPPPRGELFVDYGQRLRECIAENEWVVPPRLIEGRRSDDWHRLKLENPVFVSLSTLISEDFGVSVAQAQALGWPCLLSAWGAHRDVVGPNVRYVPVSSIGWYESRELVTLKARQLARELRALTENPADPGASAPPPSSSSRRCVPPAPITVAELDTLRARLIAKLGAAAALVGRGELYRMNSTRDGTIFFSKYRQIFSAPARPAECVVLVSNFSPTRNPLITHIPEACRQILEAAIAAGTPLTFLSADEVFCMDTLAQLLNAKRVILPFYIEEMLPMVRFLRSSLPRKVPFTVFARRAPKLLRPAALRKLETGLVGPADRLRDFASAGALKSQIRNEFDPRPE